MGLFGLLPPQAADSRSRPRSPTSSTRTPPSWCRRASTNIRARAPGTTPRCCSASPDSRPRSRCRAGAPIRSGSRWSARWSKACCAHTPARPARSARCAQRARARRLRSLSGAGRARRAGVARAARRAGAAAPADRAASAEARHGYPEQWAQTYFDLMPIHEKLRGRDFPTTRNYLRVTICNIHDEFVEAARRAGGRARSAAGATSRTAA